MVRSPQSSVGPSKSVLVYTLHSLEYVLGLARFRVFVTNIYIYIITIIGRSFKYVLVFKFHSLDILALHTGVASNIVMYIGHVLKLLGLLNLHLLLTDGFYHFFYVFPSIKKGIQTMAIGE